MKTTAWRRAGAVALLACIGAAAPLTAQRGRGGGGMGPGNYDVGTELTFAGTVQEVLTLPGPAGGPGGLHVTVRSETGIHDVHLGPAAFMQSQGWEFAAGDAITVTGSKVTVNGQEAVLAREIHKGDRALTLRDARGIPAWAGRGRGP